MTTGRSKSAAGSAARAWRLYAGLPLALALLGLQAASSAGQDAPLRRLPPSVLKKAVGPATWTLSCPASLGVHLGLGAPQSGWSEEAPHGGQWHATLDETGAHIEDGPGGKTLVCSYRALNQNGVLTLTAPLGPRFCRARADRTGFDCGDRPNF